MMTVSQYAEHLGVNVSTVYHAIQVGRIRRDGNDLIDADEADTKWARQTHPTGAHWHQSRQRKRLPGPVTQVDPSPGQITDPTFVTARTQREIWESKLKELRYKERSGELIEARAVEVASENRHRLLRQTIMQVPDRLAPQLAVESDGVKVHEILAGELRRILEDFSKGRMG
jgi:hypothetical protein